MVEGVVVQMLADKPITVSSEPLLGGLLGRPRGYRTGKTQPLKYLHNHIHMYIEKQAVRRTSVQGRMAHSLFQSELWPSRVM